MHELPPSPALWRSRPHQRDRVSGSSETVPSRRAKHSPGVTPIWACAVQRGLTRTTVGARSHSRATHARGLRRLRPAQVATGEPPMSGFLRWAGGDDQCYWLTAFLAAHDAQALMRRKWSLSWAFPSQGRTIGDACCAGDCHGLVTSRVGRCRRVNRWDLPGGRREADRFNGLPTSPNCDEVRNE